jgi:hypothetical protein
VKELLDAALEITIALLLGAVVGLLLLIFIAPIIAMALYG